MYNFEDLKVGVKYVEWGDDIRKGIDCMGLVIHCLKKRRIEVDHLKDRTSKTFIDEALNGDWDDIDIKSVDITDRTVVVGFLNEDGDVYHVAIMIDKNRFYHCPDTKGLTMSSFTRPFWERKQKMFIMHKTI